MLKISFSPLFIKLIVFFLKFVHLNCFLLLKFFESLLDICNNAGLFLGHFVILHFENVI